jgi:hypothetical protein
MSILSLLVLFSTGCVIVPTPEHGLLSGRGEICEEDLTFLKIGKTTLVDVLLRFGEPDFTRNNNKVLVYQWKVIGGYYAVGGGYSGDAGPLEISYLLLLEFDKGNYLKRFERKKPGWFDGWSYESCKVVEEWAPDPDEAMVLSKADSDLPAFLIRLFPSTGLAKTSSLSRIPKVRVYVGAFEYENNPISLGYKVAAFDVKVNEVLLMDRTIREVVRDSVASTWQTAGHELVQSDQDITVSGIIDKFEVDSPAHLLRWDASWDAVATIQFSLFIGFPQHPDHQPIRRQYKASQKIETISGPNQDHFEQAVNQCLQKIIQQMLSDAELVARIKYFEVKV